MLEAGQEREDTRRMAAGGRVLPPLVKGASAALPNRVAWLPTSGRRSPRSGAFSGLLWGPECAEPRSHREARRGAQRPGGNCPG